MTWRSWCVAIHTPSWVTHPRPIIAIAICTISQARISQGLRWQFYLARCFSLLLSCGSVVAVWHAGRELALLTGQQPGRLALLAAGLVAFNPQFLFISAAVNNDNLVTLLASLTIWQMLAMLRTGLQTRRSLGLALLLALVSISKISGLLLVIPVALAALYVARRSGNYRGLRQLAAMMTVCWLLLAAPWYARNLMLYGELTGAQTTVDIIGSRPPPSLAQMLGEEFNGLRASYQGLFGWFNIFSPAPYYVAMDLVLLVGSFGLLLRLGHMLKQRHSPAPHPAVDALRRPVRNRAGHLYATHCCDPGTPDFPGQCCQQRPARPRPDNPAHSGAPACARARPRRARAPVCQYPPGLRAAPGRLRDFCQGNAS